MKTHLSILVLFVLLFAVGLIFFLHVKSMPDPKAFTFYKIEKTFSWTDGPDVDLNPTSIKNLNAELDKIANREMPGKGMEYPVVSLGKRRVEVMYLGSENVPEALQTTLDGYIVKRLPELAREQALSEQTR